MKQDTNKMITIITVGKIKDENLHALSQNYLTRTHRLKFPQVKLILWKDMGERKLTEKIQDYKRKHSSRQIILLDEAGKTHTTQEFLYYVEAHEEDTTIFIAGAFGFSQTIKEECKEHLSLSKLTFPHEIALVLLLEQLYRIGSLKAGLPYHKE